MFANSEGSSVTARLRRPDQAFAGHLCDKYHNLMSWLILLCLENIFLQFSIKKCVVVTH